MDAARREVRVAEEGLATYYANRFAGRRTASGERYSPSAMTAAHRTLPFGTVVDVLRIDEGGRRIPGEARVRINDRGPFGGRGRIIDVSYAAAKSLGMLRAGVVRVRVEVVSRGASPARRRSLDAAGSTTL